MGPFLFTADLHLTDKPDDEYRWQLFDWMARRIHHYKVKSLFILGDLTDQKDHHSSRLVNRIIDNLLSTASLLPEGIHILMGNHDYLAAECPFFGFLSDFDNITFHRVSKVIRVGGAKFLMMPHQRTNVLMHHKGGGPPDFVLFHQAIRFARLPEGKLQDGIGVKQFLSLRKSLILGGDIHVPQLIHSRQDCIRVRYVGAPYPIHFGDDYEPRLLMYRRGKLKNLKPKTIRKVKVTIRSVGDLEDYSLAVGDQVKVVVEMPRRDFADWIKVKKSICSWMEDHKVRLKGLELRQKVERVRLVDDLVGKPVDSLSVFKDYCEAWRDVIDLPCEKVGANLLGEAIDEAH